MHDLELGSTRLQCRAASRKGFRGTAMSMLSDVVTVTSCQMSNDPSDAWYSRR